MPRMNALERPPTGEPGASAKHREYPKANHITLVTQAQARHCMKTVSWFLRRTSPP